MGRIRVLCWLVALAACNDAQEGGTVLEGADAAPLDAGAVAPDVREPDASVVPRDGGSPDASPDAMPDAGPPDAVALDAGAMATEDAGADPCQRLFYFDEARVPDDLAGCASVVSVVIDLCDGDTDELTLPVLRSTEETLQLCLDEADVVRAPALRDPLAIHLDIRSDEARLEVDGVEVRRLAVVAGPRVESLRVRGVVSAGDVLEVEGGSVQGTLLIADVRSAGTVRLTDNADIVVLEHLERARQIWAVGSLLSWGRAPALVEVDGDVRASGQDFVALEAPRLETVGGSLRLPGGPFADDAEFPALRAVGGDLLAERWIDCELQSCADLAPGPGAYHFPNLESVGGELRLADTLQVETQALPALTHAGRLTITGNQALAEVTLPALIEVGDVTVTDNPALPDCLARRLFEGVAVQGEVTIERNRAGCTCEGEPVEVTCD